MRLWKFTGFIKPKKLILSLGHPWMRLPSRATSRLYVRKDVTSMRWRSKIKNSIARRSTKARRKTFWPAPAYSMVRPSCLNRCAPNWSRSGGLRTQSPPSNGGAQLESDPSFAQLAWNTPSGYNGSPILTTPHASVTARPSAYWSALSHEGGRPQGAKPSGRKPCDPLQAALITLCAPRAIAEGPPGFR